MLQLPGGIDDDPFRQQKFEVIAGAMPGFGGKSVEVRYGTATLTWANGAASSAGLAVSHGLGRAPVTVVACQSGAGSTAIPVIAAFSLGATTFSLQGTYVSGTSAGVTTVTAGWIAIG